MAVGVPADAGVEATVVDRAGGDDSERREVGGDAGLRLAVEAGWDAEVPLMSEG